LTDQPAYTPTLPPEFAHLKVDSTDVRYKAAVDFARENKLTQAQFTNLLGVEARGVVARQAVAAPAPAPAPAPTPPKASEPIPGYEKMSFAQRWQAGEARRNGGR
jgi:hypothetical protein